MMFNKRGLSMIITTLILIVLVLVAVAIIWVVVNNILKGGTEGIALGKFTLDAGIKNVNIDNSSNNVSLTVKRNPGKGELSGMKFIFYDGTNSEIVTEENMTLKELEQRRFNFHLINLNVDNLIRISIVPIFKSDSGKEIMGNIVDTYNVGGVSECIANCTDRECGSDGCGGICGDCVILHGDGWYCQDGTCIEGVNPCQLTSASWNETNVVEGTLVTLNVIGTDCIGIDLNYTIWEDDASLNPDDFADSFIATGLGTTWIAEWQDDTDGLQSNPPEYYFIARVVGETEEVTSDDPLLEVTQACIVTCATNPGCRSSLTNGQIVSGECCGTGDCYDCETGYSWNGSSCVAGCIPETCASLGYECGTHANGTCAGTLDCNNPGCGIHSTCPSGTCVCDSGWGDCNNNNSCDCDLSSNSCVGGNCVATNIIYALSCNQTDVQNAIDSAVDGDTVVVPAGSCTWSSTLSITKGIYLIGAGAESTVIRNTGSSYLILYDPFDYDLNNPFRLSGFTFDANGEHILRLGSGKTAPFTLQTKVRVDHNEFTNSGSDVKGQAIWNLGSLYGVVDNNMFDGVNYPIANSYGVGGDDWWVNSPQNIFEHGSAYYLYYEDNTFINMAGYSGGADNIIMDGEYASRYVFRYNTVINSAPSYSLLEMHGQQGEGPASMPASFGAEAYGNQITHGLNAMTFWKQRSGQSLIFLNNAITSTTPGNIAYTSSLCVCPVNYVALKVTHNSYWWGSRKNFNGVLWGAGASGGLDCNGLTDIPMIGRDIFIDISSPGISCGTLSNLPATCTVNQGYWATSQSCSDLTGMVGVNPATPISGTLYKCTSTNTWTDYYTPYTYPHPLTLT